MSKTHCLIIGSATLDTIAHLADNQEPTERAREGYTLWKKGAKYEVKTMTHGVGGGALNSALCLTTLGHPTTVHCAIGNDDAGKKIRAFTQEKTIQMRPVITNGPTGTSFVIPTQGDRTIFTHHGANTQITQKTCAPDIYSQSQALYLAPLHGDSIQCAPWIIQTARNQYEQNTLSIALNPSIQHIQEATAFKAILPLVDIVIVNTEELLSCIDTLKPRFFTSSGAGIIKNGPPLARTLLTHQKATCTLYEISKELLSYGIKRLVVTDGSQGAYIITKDTLYYHKALPVTVGTALGAGDTFGATFFSLLLTAHGMNIENALRGATINAASVIHHTTPHQGLLSFKELEKKIKTIDPSLLKIYPFCSL